MPNPAVGAIGFGFITMIMSYVLFHRKDFYGFLLIIYICSHFSYADNQGGLWNLMAFGLTFLYILFNPYRERLTRTNIMISFILLILICMNIIGWFISNPLPIIQRFLGAATFFGYILIFNTTRKIEITPIRFRQFLTVSLVMFIYLIIISLNQRYAIINWNTPLLGAYGAEHGVITYGTTNAKGTFRNSELFGEYSVLLLALVMPMFCSSTSQQELKFHSWKFILLILSAIFCILLTSTRSAAILAIFVMCIYFFIFLIRPLVAIDRIGRQLWLIMAFFLFLPAVGVFVGSKSLEADFGNINSKEMTVENIVSGKAINRGALFTLALKRIRSQSWIIGNGFGVPRGNLWAWLGTDPEKLKKHIAGFHNLYLSLPMIYGWFGSAAFIILIGYSGFRIFIASLIYRQRRNFLVVVAAGFTVFWIIFFLDQYKISILRNPNYHMIFWIWLGLSNAVAETFKIERTDK